MQLIQASLLRCLLVLLPLQPFVWSRAAAAPAAAAAAAAGKPAAAAAAASSAILAGFGGQFQHRESAYIFGSLMPQNASVNILRMEKFAFNSGEHWFGRAYKSPGTEQPHFVTKIGWDTWRVIKQ